MTSGKTPLSQACSRAALQAAFAFVLLRMTLTTIYDLDHGFYIAAGRRILEHGFPRAEWYLPLLGDTPFASLWLLSAPIFAAVWDAFGPAGLVLMKALCYGGAFVLSAHAAMRRGAAEWAALLVSGLAVAAVATRFVERPGMFSALFLALIIWLYARPAGWWREAMLLPLFVLWSFMHAEWYVGAGTATLLLLSPETTKSPFWQRLAWTVTWLLVPVGVFLLLHPAGLKPLLSPFAFLFQSGPQLSVREYSLATWWTMPLAAPLVLALLWPAWREFRQRRWTTGLLLVGFVLLTIRIPRGALPALIVGVPYLAECLRGSNLRLRYGSAVALVTIALAQAAWSPWLALGLRLDPTLDTRGVAAVLDRVEEVEGPVLAEDVFSSLLLKHPAVVLQGVIADGRQEAFPIGYYADVYQPLLRPGANWPELIGRTGVAFYYEPFPRRENSPSLAGAFESLGWRLVAWDESGRLFARPDVIARHGLEVLKVDPARLESLQSVGDEQLRAAADEVLQRTEWLEEQGFPSARGRIAHARLALAAGDLEAAAASLDKAAAEGAARFSSYWQTLAAVRMMQGDIEGAAEAEARGR